MTGTSKPHGGWTTMAAALAVAAPAAAQDSPAREWPRTMYACRYYGQLEGSGGMLEFETLFEEDGSVFSENAKWSLDMRPFNDLRRPGPPPRIVQPGADGVPIEGFITVEWPSSNSWDKSPPQSAEERATVRFSNFGLFRRTMRKKERWHRTVIARGSELLVYGEGADRGLFLSPTEPTLIRDYGDASNMDLKMPVANLFAWGVGLETLTVYDVFVEPRRNLFPNGPAGKMRIVGEYRIDLHVLSAAFGAMRAQHRGWQASLGDVKANCQATDMDDPEEVIIVT